MFRRLAYSDRFVETLIGKVEGVPDGPPFRFVFPAEGACAPVFLTADEFKKVFTALRNGADLTYSEDADQVVWYFIRNFEYPVEGCALSCDEIIQCITENPGTRQALLQWLSTDDGAKDFLAGLSNKGVPITGPGGLLQNNNKSELFGSITFLVDTIHAAILDFYEIFESATNSRERGELVFRAFPVLETLPFDEMSEFISDLEDNIVEGYQAQWTTTPVTGSRDRIRCALFCAAVANGNELTWPIVEDYFWSRVGFTPGNILNVLVEMAGFIVSGSWAGEEIVDISFGNFAAAMRQMQKFGSQSFPSIEALMRLGQGTPDPDWAILCQDCPPDTDCYDFTSGKQGWETYPFTTGYPEQATYHPGQGWGYIDLGQFGQILRIRRDGMRAFQSVKMALAAPLAVDTTFVVSGYGFQNVVAGTREYEFVIPGGWPAGEEFGFQIYPSSDTSMTLRLQSLCLSPL